MEFNREELLAKLNIASLAVHSQDFIPILAHFCFDGKYVTAYDDVIAIRIPCGSNFACALEADTILKLLNKVPSEEITLAFTPEKIMFFRAKSGGTGTRVRLPFIDEENFIFKFPNLKAASGAKLSDAVAEQFFTGIQCCLTSIGDSSHHPAAMGITLDYDNEEGLLYLYSTNDKSISRYEVKKWPLMEIRKIILPTSFCKAILKASEEYGCEEVKIYVGKGYAIVTFAGSCRMYCKLVNNKDPLDFEDIIRKHLPRSYAEESKPIPDELIDVFDRSLIILSPNLNKFVKVVVSMKKLTITAESKLGRMKDTAHFRKSWGREEISYYIDTNLVLDALKGSDLYKMHITDLVTIFIGEDYLHLIANVDQPPQE